jgi:16S rRNA G527 N7-methylase RsmG
MIEVADRAASTAPGKAAFSALDADDKRVSVYQPEQQGLKFPEVPVFATHAEERQHRKERLVAACRAFAQHGFDYGFAGHLTVRDPEIRSCTGPIRCASTSRR